ncbi:1176_t:CDS:2 [Diversispora eburnea]|uniref:1176_t:CDS:1 n=1 Tax=Diversispora eburnea TaxID=1213867 RepID=A0A9N9CC32_9GLOM|nr:1176_t:CDS:2 [Diversispora eburnea]
MPKYFERDPAAWDIIDFLSEYEAEPFDSNIDTYLKDLQRIVNSQKGKRAEKAKLLIKDYREASKKTFKSYWKGKWRERRPLRLLADPTPDPLEHSWPPSPNQRQPNLKEIRDTCSKDLPEMPTDLLKYVSFFRRKTTEELRIALDTRQDWEGKNFNKTRHFNFDWVKNSVYNLVLEFESDMLQQSHLEAWYNIHVWTFIDKSFNELEGVDIVRGESCSLASSKRKNNRRIIQGIVKTTRKSIGRRGDLIVRKGPYEYGASEVGKDYEGDNGSKLLKERGLKSPKMLKDMMIDLGNFVEWKTDKLRQFELVSFIHAGLFMILLRMDVPAGYICRITRSDTLQVPTNVSQFEKALKCLVLTWKAKTIICKTIDVVEEMCDDDVLEDLQGAGTLS